MSLLVIFPFSLNLVCLVLDKIKKEEGVPVPGSLPLQYHCLPVRASTSVSYTGNTRQSRRKPGIQVIRGSPAETQDTGNTRQSHRNLGIQVTQNNRTETQEYR